MFKSIIKRDGREVPFDETKITDAIFKAARAVGGEDRPGPRKKMFKILSDLSGTRVPPVKSWGFWFFG